MTSTARGGQGDLLRPPPSGRPDAAGQARLFDGQVLLRGELVKVHARKPPGGRSTDPADMPTGTEIYATRDVERLRPYGGRSR